MHAKSIAFVALVIVLTACAGPEDELVLEDFKMLVSRNVGAGVATIVNSIAPGEGDADNVYIHIEFDLEAERDIDFESGWLKGISIREGDRLSGGEVVILYQQHSGGRWRATWHDLTRPPKSET